MFVCIEIYHSTINFICSNNLDLKIALFAIFVLLVFWELTNVKIILSVLKFFSTQCLDLSYLMHSFFTFIDCLPKLIGIQQDIVLY